MSGHDLINASRPHYTSVNKTKEKPIRPWLDRFIVTSEVVQQNIADSSSIDEKLTYNMYNSGSRGNVLSAP